MNGKLQKTRTMRIALVTLSLWVALAAPVRAADPQGGGGNFARDFGYGTACVVVNLLYMPAKFVYATLGGLTGGFAYLLTGLNYDVAERIWQPSLGGNYVVTPAHLRNEQTLYFSGEIQEEQH